jgi:hypothetical protein
MSRHRKRPAPRHQAPSRRRRSEATRARARYFSPAVRRVLVTPTFAVGLGIVIAAVLAYPMTRTIISYGGTPPTGGQPCRVKGCVSGSPGDGGLATTSPGRRLATPSPALKDPDLPASSAPGVGGAPASGQRPVMQYQTMRQWQGEFIGEITITGPGGRAPANWQLRLSYSSAHIIGVWGGRWTPSGDHAVLVTPDSAPGQTGGGGDSVRVVLAVSGPPGPPSGCAFDGQTCLTSRVLEPQQREDIPNWRTR